MSKKTKAQIEKELKEKYMREREALKEEQEDAEVTGAGIEEQEEAIIAQSREFKLFEREKEVGGEWFEKLAKWSRTTGIKFSVDRKTKADIENKLSLVGIDVKAEDIYTLGILSVMLFFVIGMIAFIIVGPAGLVVSIGGFGIFMYLRAYPDRLLDIRRAKASSELILSVLYMVIFMRTTSNLEAAVKFVGDNLETALGNDFKKLLWDVQSRRYASMKEALDAYVVNWKESSPIFVDAIHLVEASLYQGSEDARIKMLNKALELSLEGTFEQMVRYANALRTPINMLYMMGIMLPVLGLVMFPIMGAFLSDIVNPVVLIILYNVILPVAVYAFAAYSLAKRPAGFPIPDIDIHPDVPPPGKFYMGTGRFRRAYSAWIPALIIGIVLIAPMFIYIPLYASFKPQEQDIYATLLIVAAPAVALIVYGRLISTSRMKIRKELQEIEREFADATFQLGNRIGEGYPLEIALTKVAAVMGKSATATLFGEIAKNINDLGMDVESAIFDPKLGAIRFYPSAIVKSILKVAIMGSKKSLDVAAVSLVNMSSYLRDIHRIDEKVQDILSETLSSMKFQSSFLAPVISGLVVGLTAMILIILDILGEQVISMMAEDEGGAFGIGAGTWILGIFQVSEAIPLFIFQPVVGIYVFEIVVLLSSIDADIELGGDPLFKFDLFSKMLPIALVIYSVVCFAVTTVFVGIARVAVEAGMVFG
jgi:hypothetical protein